MCKCENPDLCRHNMTQAKQTERRTYRYSRGIVRRGRRISDLQDRKQRMEDHNVFCSHHTHHDEIDCLSMVTNWSLNIPVSLSEPSFCYPQQGQQPYASKEPVPENNPTIRRLRMQRRTRDVPTTTY